MALIIGQIWDDGGFMAGANTVGLVGTEDDDQIYGLSGNDELQGNGGNDLLEGGPGHDDMVGGEGNDTYYVDDPRDTVDEINGHRADANGNTVNDANDTVHAYINFTLPTNVENLVLIEGSAARNGIGNGLDNRITGNSNENFLRGAAGDDELHGGDGDDELVGDFVDGEGSGDDKLYGGADNDTLRGGGGEDELYGGSHGDSLFGGNNDDLLDGGTGGDNMRGESGNDDYYVDNAGDQVIEGANEGIDEVFSTISLTLGANVEHLRLRNSGGAINGTGNGLDNEISGNDSNNTLTGEDGFDTLDGGVGADTMRGGRHDDIYFVDNSGDVVTELANQGIDTVYSQIDFTLGANVENLALQNGAVDGFGNALDNTLTGNDADNALYGYFGEDTLKGGGGADVLRGGSQNDTLKGGGGADVLRGDSGDDEMIGGTDNDTYFVDSLGDIVEELANEGVDTVNSALAAFTLGANVENLVLSTGTNGTGNGLGNVMTGNLLDNVLDGAGGADTMEGRLGNDTYFVDNVDDVVTEVVGQGVFDTVKTTVDYRLAFGSDVEQLTAADALGTAAMTLVGNEIRNTIRGNDGNNFIDGGGEADTMIGRKGDDTYIVNHASDGVTELAEEGIDQVNASVSVTLAANVENVTLTGSLGAPPNINATGNGLDNVMIGNNGRNTLDGGDGRDEIHGGGDNDFLFGGTEDDELFGDAGSDRLVGASGADKLTGGTGADTFEFRAPEDSGFAGAAADEILDFSAAQADKIDLSQIDANSLVAGDQAFTFIGNNNAFSGVPGQLRFNAGQIEGDLNGDGNGDFRIQVNVASLVAADFIL